MNQINANAPTPGDIMELAKENERLQAQLAKANKKIIELKESELDLRADCINIKKQIESWRGEFAIEQQIKALEDLTSCEDKCEMVEDEDGVNHFAVFYSQIGETVNQLRNLIDSGKT